MVKTSKKTRLAAILAVMAVVAGWGAARILCNGLPGTAFERGQGSHGWEMFHHAGPWAGRWQMIPEAERKVLFEKGMYGPQAFPRYFQQLKEQRPAALAFLAISAAGIIVLGILAFLWIDRQAKTINAVCEGDGQKTAGALKVFLLGIITFGIYGLLWLYLLGERLQDNAPRYQLSFKENGATVLLWFTLGAFILVGPVIALYTVIRNTGALAAKYDKGTAAQM